LRSAPTPEAAALFWLRLYGVVDEVRRMHEPSPLHIEQAAEACEFDIEPDPHEEQARLQDEYFSDLAVDVFEACVNLRRVFSDEELLAIQWKRDDEAHVQLHAYDLKTDRHGALDLKQAVTRHQNCTCRATGWRAQKGRFGFAPIRPPAVC